MHAAGYSAVGVVAGLIELGSTSAAGASDLGATSAVVATSASLGRPLASLASSANVLTTGGNML